MLERLPEIFILCVVGLLVFGPKRVIEMGGTLGKAWREFRESTRGLSWSALLSGDEQSGTQQYSALPPASATPVAAPAAPAAPIPVEPPEPAVVEGSVEAPREGEASRQ